MTLADGRVVRARIEHALGESENPLSRGALVERFCEMIGAPASGAVAERILAIDIAADLSLLDDPQRISTARTWRAW